MNSSVKQRLGYFLLAALALAGLVSGPQVSTKAYSPASSSARSVSDVALVRAVGAIALTVSDADRAVGFFSKVLAFQKVSDVEVLGDEYEHLEGVFGLRLRIVTMSLGSESIELKEYLTPRGLPIPPDSRSNDRWFQHIAIITSDMDRAYQWLRLHRVEHASTGPQRLPDWNRSAGGIRAFYFKDPEGHVLEVLQFPDGKGDAKWQRLAREDAGRLFLGIDHTAIVVGDTRASLKLYQDTLGLRIAGESENYGVEQERLNNVFGARLRITSLRANEGPGVEFLEYLTPRDGRTTPGSKRSNDLINWQTTLVTSDIGRTAAQVREHALSLVSTGVIDVGDARLGFSRSFVAQDEDGHALKFVQR